MAGTGMALMVNQWQNRFEGELVTPDDDPYDASRRIWNGMIDAGPP